MNAAVETEIEVALNTQEVFYSQRVGIVFKDADPIGKNAWLKKFLKGAASAFITHQDGNTSFQIESSQIGYFMHKLYLNAPEGFVIQADWDGIYTFIGVDEFNEPARFNAQLVTIRQVHESMTVPLNYGHLN